MAESWVSVDDVAAHLGVRKDSIYRWIERRGLPARKIGKLWKLKLSEVDAWVMTDRAIQAPDAADLGRDEPRRRRSAGERLVLAVDDEESVRQTLGDFLADEGYGALVAGDGAEALELLRSPQPARPSLIILDLGMPNMDGWTLREELARDPELSEIPIIIVTADRRADISGAAAVLRKPLDLEQLASALHRTLGPGGR